ncbi:MAG: MFS transporter [Anaerolineales bacterium]
MSSQPSLIPTHWQRNFFTLWSGQAVSLFGSSLVQFALVWWLTSTTGSATVLAIASLFAILPTILLGPVAGVVVDRFNRRLVMLVADSLVAAATLLLAYLFWTDAAQVWHVYAVMVFRATAGTFQFPAMQASTTLMVPEEQFARIAGFNQMLQGLMGIVAPPVGALLIGLLPLQGVLMIDTGTALLGVLALFLTHIPQPPARTVTEAAPSFGSELRAGFSYVARWPGLLALLGMAAVINLLLAPAAALLPILVTRHFNGGAPQLATLEALFSFGMVAGGLLLGVWGGFKRRILTSLLGLLLLGISFLAIGLTPADAFWFAVIASFVAAATAALTNGPLMAVLQAVVTPEMQGRVFTLIGSLSSAVTPLGYLIAGPTADAFGVQIWYVIGGVVCAAMAGLSFFIPIIRNLEDHRAEPVITLALT